MTLARQVRRMVRRGRNEKGVGWLVGGGVGRVARWSQTRERRAWGLTGACVRLPLKRLMSGTSQAGALMKEGLPGPGQGREDAGKSAAGCPGHRIIVVKYSWAFGLDAISEQ